VKQFIYTFFNLCFLFYVIGVTTSHSDIIKTNMIKPMTTLAIDESFPLTQIVDGISSDIDPFNGFISPNTKTGTITFIFENEFDIDSFFIWNDINVKDEGVRSFKLVFFDINNSILFETKSYNVESKEDAQIFNFNTVKGVQSVNLVVENSLLQIEIREIEFRGYQSGCVRLHGDYNVNSKLDLGDAIGILQEITSESDHRSFTSCKSIFENGYSKGDGYYQITPDFDDYSNSINVFCDMTTSGGGWMKISITNQISFQKLYGNSSSAVTSESFTLGMKDKTNSAIRANIETPVYFSEIRGSWTLKSGNHPDDNLSISNWGDTKPSSSCSGGDGIIAFGTSENILKSGGEWGVDAGQSVKKIFSINNIFVNQTNIIRFESHQQCAGNEESITIKDIEIYVR